MFVPTKIFRYCESTAFHRFIVFLVGVNKCLRIPGADSVGDSGVGTAQMRQENSHSRQFRDWKSPQRATGRESHAIGTQVKNATFGRGIRAARCASARGNRGATGTEIESGRGGIISGALRRTGTPCQGFLSPRAQTRTTPTPLSHHPRILPPECRRILSLPHQAS